MKRFRAKNSNFVHNLKNFNLINFSSILDILRDTDYIFATQLDALWQDLVFKHIQLAPEFENYRFLLVFEDQLGPDHQPCVMINICAEDLKIGDEILKPGHKVILRPNEIVYTAFGVEIIHFCNHNLRASCFPRLPFPQGRSNYHVTDNLDESHRWACMLSRGFFRKPSVDGKFPSFAIKSNRSEKYVKKVRKENLICLHPGLSSYQKSFKIKKN